MQLKLKCKLTLNPPERERFSELYAENTRAQTIFACHRLSALVSTVFLCSPKQVSCRKSFPPTFPVVFARILKNDVILVPTLMSPR